MRCRRPHVTSAFAFPSALRERVLRRPSAHGIRDFGYARITIDAECKVEMSLSQPHHSAAAPPSESGRAAVTAEATGGLRTAIVNAATAIATSSSWVAPFVCAVTNPSHTKRPLSLFAKSSHSRYRLPCRSTGPNGVEHPRCLNQTRGDGACAGATRPRPRAFPLPCRPELQRAVRYRHEQRTFEPECHRMPVPEFGGYRICEITRVRMVVFNRHTGHDLVRAQPKLPDRTDPTSAQKTTRSSIATAYPRRVLLSARGSFRVPRGSRPAIVEATWHRWPGQWPTSATNSTERGCVRSVSLRGAAITRALRGDCPLSNVFHSVGDASGRARRLAHPPLRCGVRCPTTLSRWWQTRPSS
jgi:hypothetical protein